MSHENIRKMIFSAIYMAVGLVLPFLTGQIPQIGIMLSPMHIPVMLCGFSCGWQWGMAVGFILPLLRSMLFTVPIMYPMAISMAFELAAYGLLTGILYKVLMKKKYNIYVTLLISMVFGRVVWGAARYIMAGLSGSEFTLSMFIAGSVTGSIPGIILHILLIPPVVMLLEKAGLVLND